MIEPREPTPPTRMQAVGYVVLIPLAMGLLLLWPAGSWLWRPGWLLIAVFLVATAIAAFILWRVNPVIFAARSRVQAGTEGWDRLLLAIFFPLFVSILPIASLDAGRFHWTTVPAWAVFLGYGLLLAGMALTTWAQAVNRFFEPGVRLQTERGQHVIDTGPYALVRHPGYVGAIAMCFGFALALGSLAALVPAVATSALLVLRTAWEDGLLQTSLPGYANFAARVRFRLLPGIW